MSAYSSRVRCWPTGRRAGSSMPIRTGPGFSAARQSSAVTSECSTDRGNSRSQQQELGDQGRLGGPAVGPDERLVRAAGAQQQRPALLRRARHPGQQQPGRHVGPLERAAEDQEPPGVVVAHGRVGQAEEQGRPLPDEPQEHVRPEPVRGAALAASRPWQATFRHSHISLEITSRMPRAPARAAEDRAGDRARALGVVGQPEQRGADVEPVVRPARPRGGRTAGRSPRRIRPLRPGSSSSRCT